MPRANQKDNKVKVGLILPLKLKEQLDEAASRTRRTISAYAEIALEAQLKKDGAR